MRAMCKECGGVSICEHNRLRSRCIECGGGSICEHYRIKSNCKECGNGSVRKRALKKAMESGLSDSFVEEMPPHSKHRKWLEASPEPQSESGNGADCYKTIGDTENDKQKVEFGERVTV